MESHSRIFTVVNLNDSGLTHAGYFLECSLLVVGSAFLAMLCMGTVQVLCSQCLCRARTTRIAPLLRTTTPTPNHYNKMNSGQNEDKVIKLNRTKRITFYKRKNRNLKDKVRPLGIFIFIFIKKNKKSEKFLLGQSMQNFEANSVVPTILTGEIQILARSVIS